MQIVIDIPEVMYQNVLNGTYCGSLYENLKNGTPLDKIRERISLEKLGYPPSAGYYRAIMKVLEIIDKYREGSESE